MNNYLFCVGGLVEDDIAFGMRAYRWRRVDEGRSRDISMLKHPKPYTVRRPVTVLRIERRMLEITLMERREQPVLPAVNAPSPTRPGITVGENPHRVYIQTGEKVDWLTSIWVRDEEYDIELEFIRDPPYVEFKPPSSGEPWEFRPAVPFYFDGPRQWRLKLGEFRDDRFETKPVQSDDEHIDA